MVIGQWRQQYNTVRSHATLGYRPPAPGACNPLVIIYLTHKCMNIIGLVHNNTRMTLHRLQKIH